MTNEEILDHLDAAVAHFEKTTVAYPQWLKNYKAGRYPNGSQWGSGFSELQAIRDGLSDAEGGYSSGKYGDGTYGRVA